MAQWGIKKLDKSKINNGVKFNDGDGLSAENINDVVESAIWVQTSIENITTNATTIDSSSSANAFIKYDNNGYPIINFEIPKGEKGESGEKGTIVRYNNNYNITTTYYNNGEYLDIVYYNGASYIPLNSSVVGIEPSNSTYWGVLAQKGENGDGLGNMITNPSNVEIDSNKRYLLKVISKDNNTTTFELTESTEIITSSVLCNHEIEITGQGENDCNLAIKDQDVLITKIQGQTQFTNGSLVNSKVKNLVSTNRNILKLKENSNAMVSNVYYNVSGNYITTSGGTANAWQFLIIDSDGELKNNSTFTPKKPILLANKTYSIKHNGTFNYGYLAVWYADGSTEQITYNKVSQLVNYTPSKDVYGVGLYPASQNQVVTSQTFQFWINVGEEILDYEKYVEDKINVNLELGAFDYHDNLTNKTYYQTSSLTTLSNNVNLTLVESDLSNYPYCFKTNTFVGINSQIVCSLPNDSYGIGISSDGYILIYHEVHSDVDVILDEIIGNPINLVYKLAIPNVVENVIVSGYKCWNNGYQIQEIYEGYLPYILSKQYAISLASQVLNNVEIDKRQQEQIDEIKNIADYISLSGNTEKTITSTATTIEEEIIINNNSNKEIRILSIDGIFGTSNDIKGKKIKSKNVLVSKKEATDPVVNSYEIYITFAYNNMVFYKEATVYVNTFDDLSE